MKTMGGVLAMFTKKAQEQKSSDPSTQAAQFNPSNEPIAGNLSDQQTVSEQLPQVSPTDPAARQPSFSKAQFAHAEHFTRIERDILMAMLPEHGTCTMEEAKQTIRQFKLKEAQ